MRYINVKQAVFAILSKSMTTEEALSRVKPEEHFEVQYALAAMGDDLEKASTDDDIAEVYQQELLNPRNTGAKIAGMGGKTKPWAKGGRGSTKSQTSRDVKAQKQLSIQQPVKKPVLKAEEYCKTDKNGQWTLGKAEPLSKPPVSEAQRKAMWAAASGKSNLDIPKSVGKDFAESDQGGKLPEKKSMKKEEKEYYDYESDASAKPESQSSSPRKYQGGDPRHQGKGSTRSGQTRAPAVSEGSGKSKMPHTGISEKGAKARGISPFEKEEKEYKRVKVQMDSDTYEPQGKHNPVMESPKNLKKATAAATMESNIDEHVGSLGPHAKHVSVEHNYHPSGGGTSMLEYSKDKKMHDVVHNGVVKKLRSKGYKVEHGDYDGDTNRVYVSKHDDMKKAIKPGPTLDYGKINPKEDYEAKQAKAPTIDYGGNRMSAPKRYAGAVDRTQNVRAKLESEAAEPALATISRRQRANKAEGVNQDLDPVDPNRTTVKKDDPSLGTAGVSPSTVNTGAAAAIMQSGGYSKSEDVEKDELRGYGQTMSGASTMKADAEPHKDDPTHEAKEKKKAKKIKDEAESILDMHKQEWDSV